MVLEQLRKKFCSTLNNLPQNTFQVVERFKYKKLNYTSSRRKTMDEFLRIIIEVGRSSLSIT